MKKKRSTGRISFWISNANYLRSNRGGTSYTVSYAQIIKSVRAVFTKEKYDLIEKAAQTVAGHILKSYPPIKAVEVTLKKPEAPIKADFGYVAVRIRRTRDE